MKAGPFPKLRILLAGVLLLGAGLRTGAAPLPPPGSDSPVFRDLPAAFAAQVRDRGLIDRYQELHHRTSGGAVPVPRPASALAGTARRPVRTVRRVDAAPPVPVLAYRTAHAVHQAPLRGFRAPILDRAGALGPVTRAETRWTPAEERAGLLVEERLARDGLLPTLASVIAELASAPPLPRGPDLLAALERVGFPADLARHFRLPGSESGAGAAEAVVDAVARRVVQGAPLTPLRDELGKAVFEFQPTHRGFRIATDSGEEEVGLLRIQAGGGWRDGVVPGEPFDVAGRLVSALPSSDFVVHVWREAVEPVSWLADHAWPLRRRGQLVLCVETVEISPWAQDNGKAGLVEEPVEGGGRAMRRGTLVPRYAALGEGPWTFVPGDSYLADTLASAGHLVIGSPLLFQGGNLLAARHPATGERILFLGESTLHANVALGLSADQVREAFRRELGVDRCEILPSVSYHLDFDVAFRVMGQELVAFVNDPDPVLRQVIGLGVDALERAGSLPAPAAREVREALAQGAPGRALDALDALDRVPALRPGAEPFPAAVAAAFVSGPDDDAEGNLQVFLLARELLRARLGPAAGEPADADTPPGRREFLGALRRLDGARTGLSEALDRLGLRRIAIPSLPDLHRGVNYLNAIHHRGGVVLPGLGGFYAAVDRAAEAAYRAALGPGARIEVIPCAGCQRRHGGIRCLVSAHPALPPAP